MQLHMSTKDKPAIWLGPGHHCAAPSSGWKAREVSEEPPAFPWLEGKGLSGFQKGSLILQTFPP